MAENQPPSIAHDSVGDASDRKSNEVRSDRASSTSSSCRMTSLALPDGTAKSTSATADDDDAAILSDCGLNENGTVNGSVKNARTPSAR